MNSTIKERLEATLTKYHISKNKASREIGYSGAVLSAYTTGSYSGDVIKLEDAIVKWCARKDQAHSRKRVPIVETSALKTITNAIQLTHSEHDIALIVADAGSGKTTAAKRYADKNDLSVVYIPVVAGMNRKMLTSEIAQQLGLETTRVPQNVLVKNIADALSEVDSLVILDEADYLKADALEFVRRLVYDLGEAGLVLIGLPTLRGLIQNLHQDHRQLESRIGINLDLEGLTLCDATLIARSVWENCSMDIVKAIFDVSKNDTRQFCKIVERMQNTMVLNKMEEPTIEVVEVSSSMVLKRRSK